MSDLRTSDVPTRETTSLFHPGENCHRVARAEQIAFLVDGEEYFLAVKEAIEAAQETILILAWDFDSRTGLAFDPDGKPTVTLGDLLNRWVRGRANRHAYVLIWDYPMIYGFDREFPPIYGLGWKPERRVHICYDNAIPMGASHHQKVVVIDDRLAFCGGLDLTGRRWDTCAHKAAEDRRRTNGKHYPPFHDAMMAVSGEAALALGDLARERWHAATGEELRPPGGPRRGPGQSLARWRSRWGRRRESVRPEGLWPPSLEVTIKDSAVAIARTLPAGPAEPAVREVEALYLDMIRAAKRWIYIENQYFTADRLGEALAERLAEADGPEIVVVIRLLSHGWLEGVTMQRLRTRLIGRLREADRHGRFRVYYPHVEGLAEGECLDVHSKLMIVDDEVLRIGSANFANRSMGFDTECDLAIEAGGDEERAQAIAALRTRLLAEHLGVRREMLSVALDRDGSLIAAIESLVRPSTDLKKDERTLRVLEETNDAADERGTVLQLADPEETVPLDGLIKEFRPGPELPVEAGPAWIAVLGAALILALLAAIWRWTPLSGIATGEMVVDVARRTADSPWTAPALLAGYVAATFVIFPRPLLTLFGVLAFGPWVAFGLAMLGVLAATWANYLVGRKLPRRTVRRFAGRSLNRVMEVLRRRGFLAVTALRLVPVAPFAVPGIVAGAAHLPLRDVLLGTFLGNLPGTFITTILGDRLHAVLADPRPIDYWLLVGVIVGAVAAAYLLRRAFSRIQLPLEPS